MNQETKKTEERWCCEGGPERFGLMMKRRACGNVLRRHRFAVFTSLAVMGIGFLVLQVGWVLGVIAFFRTL